MEPLLRNIVGEEEEEEEEGRRDDPLMLYFIKVMRLFEQVSAIDMVVRVASEASERGDRDCPSTVGHSHKGPFIDFDMCTYLVQSGRSGFLMG